MDDISPTRRQLWFTPENKSYAHLVGLRHFAQAFTVWLYICLGLGWFSAQSNPHGFQQLLPVILVVAFLLAAGSAWMITWDDFTQNCANAFEYGESRLPAMRKRQWRLIWRWNPISTPFSVLITFVMAMRNNSWEWGRGIR